MPGNCLTFIEIGAEQLAFDAGICWIWICLFTFLQMHLCMYIVHTQPCCYIILTSTGAHKNTPLYSYLPSTTEYISMSEWIRYQFEFSCKATHGKGVCCHWYDPPLCQCCQDQRGVAHAISEDALAAMASWEAWIGHGLGEAKLQNTKTTTQFCLSQSVPNILHNFIYVHAH